MEFIAIIIAYLLGSIPFGLLIAKYKAGTDIREHGSGNIGATNVLRICGRNLGLLTFALDTAKGSVAVAIAILCGDINIQSLAALAVVLGHIFPYWLKFKGGKGVATAIGAYAILYWPLMLIWVIFWGITFAATRISSLSAIVACILSLVIAWIYPPNSVGAVATIINILILVRHKDNIMRLLRGEEKSM